jgi:hypothetical protein
MMILDKITKLIKQNGIIKTIRLIFKYPYSIWKRRNFEKRLVALDTTENRFTWIYKSNYWGNAESLSGTGSTLEYTENLRKELPKLITDFNIKSILDAPCGDFHWMKALLPTLNVNYIGADIVEDLVHLHNSNYKNNTIEFIKLNLITDNFPYADLMICRDCLFHLSYEDIQSVLTNFKNSEIPYILTTTHKINNLFQNKDIQTGDFRTIDLFSYPFNFPKKPLFRIVDSVSQEEGREMCLFSREQILSIEL